MICCYIYNCYYFFAVQPECYPETLDLNNFVNTTTDPGLYALTGHPTVCVAGKNVPICANVALNNLEIVRICAYSQGLISTNGMFIIILKCYRWFYWSSSRCNGTTTEFESNG